jgi:hypothetical protein
MYKFEISYKCKDTDATRCATVFAENLEAAEQKIITADPQFKELDDVAFTEKPNWRRAEDV